MASRQQPSEAATRIVSVILYLLVLGAVASSVWAYAFEVPILFLILSPLLALTLIAATLELAGHPAERLGSVTVVLALLAGLYLWFTSPTRDPSGILFWFPASILWLVLYAIRRQQAPPPPVAA